MSYLQDDILALSQIQLFLPEDIIKLIFLSLPITDKRSFMRTCHTYHKYSKLMPQIEKEFQSMIIKTKFFDKTNFTGFSNSLYKYTIELIYDDYDHLFPDKYIIPENRILHQYRKIYYRIGLKGNLNMFKKFLRVNRNYYFESNIEKFMDGAAQSNRIQVLKWMKNKDYKFSSFTTAYAIKGGN